MERGGSPHSQGACTVTAELCFIKKTSSIVRGRARITHRGP